MRLKSVGVAELKHKVTIVLLKAYCLLWLGSFVTSIVY